VQVKQNKNCARDDRDSPAAEIADDPDGEEKGGGYAGEEQGEGKRDFERVGAAELASCGCRLSAGSIFLLIASYNWGFGNAMAGDTVRTISS